MYYILYNILFYGKHLFKHNSIYTTMIKRTNAGVGGGGGGAVVVG